jgi:uncharacterized protein (DUF2062 family)
MNLSQFFRKRARRRRGVHKTRRKGWRAHGSEVLWPSMGWRAFFRYMVLQVLRLADNPHRVALGVAVGVWVSWTPFLGFHNLAIVTICWLTGASILAGLASAFIGNPWTFPFMWWSAYELGQRVLGLHHVKVLNILEGLTLHKLLAHLWPLVKLVFLPTLTGAAILGFINAAIFYWLALRAMQAYTARRAKRWAEQHGHWQ